MRTLLCSCESIVNRNTTLELQYFACFLNRGSGNVNGSRGNRGLSADVVTFCLRVFMRLASRERWPDLMG
jgi:hypothetical protein